MKNKIGDNINGFELIEKVSKRGYWKVKHSCGRIFDFRIVLSKKQNYCKGCIGNFLENNHGSNHKSWKGFGELSSDLFTTIKLNARERELEFDLDLEYLWNLFVLQDRKCSISGIEIFLNGKCDKKKYKTATLDRIDSTLGYIKGNVQWVHRDINKIKNNLPQDYFFYLCSKVSSNNKINVGIYDDNIFYKKDKYISIEK